MTEQRLFVGLFCLLDVCFLIWPGQAQVPDPAQCLVSGTYSLIQRPETKDDKSCWDNCYAEPDCHMAVVTKALDGSGQCLLVNCLNRGSYSLRRDPSAQISVYPKSTADKEQMQLLMGSAYTLANEKVRCFTSMNYSSCHSGTPRFFYNSTSLRCERFLSGCGSSRNTFETQAGCEALCNETFRCYRPRQHGGCKAHFPKFFYNVKTLRCERFFFSGCASNGNMFTTVEDCETLCADVKDPPAPDSTSSKGNYSAFICTGIAFGLLLPVVIFVSWRYCKRPSSFRLLQNPSALELEVTN